MTVCYIVGLGHSGSTLAERLLVHMTEACGIGEAQTTLAQWDEATLHLLCSCGSKAADCVLWGEVCGAGDSSDRYATLYRSAEKLGNGLVIDSSKTIQGLRTLQRNAPHIPIQPILVVRPALSWATTERNREYYGSGLVPTSRLLLSWSRSMSSLYASLWLDGHPFGVLSIADLVDRPVQSAESVGLSISRTYVPGKEMRGEFHALNGNRMRLDPTRSVARREILMGAPATWQRVLRSALLLPAVIETLLRTGPKSPPMYLPTQRARR